MRIEENQNIQPKLNREFIELKSFTKCWEDNNLTDEDLRELQNKILTEPAEADLGSGLFKFRYAPKREHRGQSGAYRVLFVDVLISEHIYLLYCFDKNDKVNISKAELESFKAISKHIYGAEK